MFRRLTLFALLCALLLVPVGSASAEQAGSSVRRVQAGLLDAGGLHSCAILWNGDAACWGNDAQGQLGDDAVFATQPTPMLVALPDGRRATAITAGIRHTCAILDDGSAACWGFDGFGQLGDDAVAANKPTPVPVALPAGRAASDISAGDNHTCAILDDGVVTCWGSDTFGQLGNGVITGANLMPVPVALPAGRTATAISPDSSASRVGVAWARSVMSA